MSKRKKKHDSGDGTSPEETAAENNGSIGTESRVMTALSSDANKLHELRLLCRRFNRLRNVTPERVQEFVKGAFLVAGEDLK